MRAATIDPERFPLPEVLEAERFTLDVIGCLEHMPAAITEAFAQVEVEAAEWPTLASLQREDPPRSPLSLVLVEDARDGHPRIVLYRRNFELARVAPHEVREVAAGLIVDELERLAHRKPTVS